MKFRGVRPVFVRTISDAYIPIVPVDAIISQSCDRGQ